MLSKKLSEDLERQQRKIIRIIFGREESYDRALIQAGLEQLDMRRQALIDRFAIRLSNSDKFASWFPVQKESGYATLSSQKYEEKSFRTERLRRAPLYRY